MPLMLTKHKSQPITQCATPYSSFVVIDIENILSNEFDDVFSPQLTGYYGHARPFEVHIHVNMGPV